MTTTNTVMAADLLKGPEGASAEYCFRIAVQTAGAYNTAARPTFDVWDAINALKQIQNDTGFVVHKVVQFRDAYGATGTRYTNPNSQISLADGNGGTGSASAVTFKIYTGTGAHDGEAGSGSELTTDNLTLMHEFIAVVTIPSGEI